MVHQSIGISAICHHLSSIMLVASFHQPMDDNSPWAFSTCRTLLVHTQGIQKKGEISKDVLFFQQCDHLPSPCQQMIWSDFTSYIIRHTSYIICHISYIIHHISYIINHISYFIHRTSYILHPTSYIIHHTSSIIYHISYIIYHNHVVFHYNYISYHVIWYYMIWFDLIWCGPVDSNFIQLCLRPSGAPWGRWR
jgi:hypothetical protein